MKRLANAIAVIGLTALLAVTLLVLFEVAMRSDPASGCAASCRDWMGRCVRRDLTGYRTFTRPLASSPLPPAFRR